MVQVDSGADLDRLLELCTVKLSISGKSGWGTGFFVAPGKILTCAHVVKDAGTQPVKVSYQNQQDIAEATVSGLFLDPFDIALLELVQPIPNHPCVYLDSSTSQEQVIQSNDELYTYGYPDDFPQGGPVTTACEGLTGDRPPLIKFKQGQIRPGLSGSPLLNRRTSKICGIVKFTRDRSNDLGGGAVPAPAILTKFSELESLQTQFHKQNRSWHRLLPNKRCSPRTVALISLGVAAAIGTVRFLGLLQDTELKVYDHLIQTRPAQGVDDRIKIVVVEADDVAAQQKREEELIGSLSHETLAKLLNKLSTYSPRVIGLDFYRPDQNQLEEYPELQNRFKSQSNLIGVCKAVDQEYQVSGVGPPPGMGADRVGFSDFTFDPGGIVRRQMLAFISPEKFPCSTEFSFSLQVAKHYLEKEGFSVENPVNDETCSNLTFSSKNKSIVFPNLRSYTGGYQYYEDASKGCQVLLNYRANQPEYAEQFVSLQQVLDNQVESEDFRDKIILVGVYHRDLINDYWDTPFGSEPNQMPGVVVQAQMVSQIIDVVKGDRSLIWVMPQWAEWLWLLGWSLGGGFLGWWFRAPRTLGVAVIAVGASIYIVCLVAFLSNGWLPLIPPLFGMSMSSAIVWWVNLHNNADFRLRLKHQKPNSTSVQS